MREFVDRGDDDIREGNDNTVENFEAKMNGGDTICKGFNDDRKDNCPHCGKIFGPKGNLEIHMHLHGSRDLFCDHCGIPAKREVIKERHMGSVHDDDIEMDGMN